MISFEVLSAASTAVANVLLVCLAGVAMSAFPRHAPVLTPHTLAVLSSATYYAFNPALIFSRMGGFLGVDMLRDSWQAVMWSAITMGVNLLLAQAWLCFRPIPDKSESRPFVVACVFSNCVALPLLLLAVICRDVDEFSVDEDCFDDAVVLAFVYTLPWHTVLWTKVDTYLASSMGATGLSLPPRTPWPAASLQPGAPQRALSGFSLRHRLQAALRQFIARPPLVAITIGIAVGLSGPLRDAVFRKGASFTPLFDTVELVAQPALPLMNLVMAGSLYQAIVQWRERRERSRKQAVERATLHLGDGPATTGTPQGPQPPQPPHCSADTSSTPASLSPSLPPAAPVCDVAMSVAAPPAVLALPADIDADATPSREPSPPTYAPDLWCTPLVPERTRSDSCGVAAVAAAAASAAAVTAEPSAATATTTTTTGARPSSPGPLVPLSPSSPSRARPRRPKDGYGFVPPFDPAEVAGGGAEPSCEGEAGAAKDGNDGDDDPDDAKASGDVSPPVRDSGAAAAAAAAAPALAPPSAVELEATGRKAGACTGKALHGALRLDRAAVGTDEEGEDAKEGEDKEGLGAASPRAGAECRRTSTMPMGTGIILIRLVLAPAVVFGLTRLAAAVSFLRWMWPEDNRLLHMVVYLAASAPSAQLVLVLTQKLGLVNTTNQLALVYIAMYGLSAITLTIWIAVFLSV